MRQPVKHKWLYDTKINFRFNLKTLNKTTSENSTIQERVRPTCTYRKRNVVESFQRKVTVQT